MKRKPDPIFAAIATHAKAVKASHRATAALDRLMKRLTRAKRGAADRAREAEHDALQSLLRSVPATQEGQRAVAALGRPCPYCGVLMDLCHRRPTRDHVIPRNYGGETSRRQRRLRLIVCARCNTDKGHRTVEKWLTLLRL